VIPAPFTYQRAGSVDEALDLAARGGEDAKFLAGGHSLLPLMKLRLAVPTVLVDIGRLSELSFARDENGHITVGALTSHHDLTNSALLHSELPLLAHAASQVGDPQIRPHGTIGGSLAVSYKKQRAHETTGNLGLRVGV
jgi:carbon-monoxide dehydrogenase medium subunit